MEKGWMDESPDSRDKCVHVMAFGGEGPPAVSD